MAVVEVLPVGPVLTACLILLLSSLGYFLTRLYHARMLVINLRKKGLVRKIAGRAIDLLIVYSR
jgi:hypothetical protein